MASLTINNLDVLLVEPSVTQQRIIMLYLFRIGLEPAQIHVATKGQDALDGMQKSTPDVVISALYLPDMTGTDLVETMRNNETLSDIPFMLISSETNYRVLDPIRQAGAIAILGKPFELEHLEKALVTTVELLDPTGIDSESFIPEELNVLIVDDSRLSRTHIRKVLSGLGMENFTEAINGKEAMDIIEGQFFDLIVTDYNMPEMDGKELVTTIRTQSNQPSVPILMVTSEQNESRIASIQQVGVSAICNKPFEPLIVRTLIEKILNN